METNRKQFVEAMKRAMLVAPANCPKPILQCARLHTEGGSLVVQATDLDMELTLHIDCKGELPPTVILAGEAEAKARAAKATECSIEAVNAEAVRFNGGLATHLIPTLDPAEYPSGTAMWPDTEAGQNITLIGPDLYDALGIAAVARSKGSSRYAIDGILLESDSEGIRLVATDGRRMVECPVFAAALSSAEWQGKTIISAKTASVVRKLIGKKATGRVTVKVEPGKEGQVLRMRGDGWDLVAVEHPGNFPDWRSVFPAAGSRFTVEREAMTEAIRAVATACEADDNYVMARIGPDKIDMEAGPAHARANASVPASFHGGGDSLIVSGFNPKYMEEAIRTMRTELVGIEVWQNTTRGTGRSFVISETGAHLPARWVVMCVNLALPNTPENRGSNYVADPKDDEDDTPSV